MLWLPELASLDRGGVRMYAIIKTGGKQYRVQKGDELFIEKLDVEADQTIEFDEVLVKMEKLRKS